MLKNKTRYAEPEIAIITFEEEKTVTTSGYEFQMEGFGDELAW